MSIGAVIVTYKNTASQLAKCLASLRQEEVQDIVIVNNDHYNKGFATAANQGAYVLNNELILFLNPDAYLAGNTLSSAQLIFEKEEKTGAVGLMLCADDGTPEKQSFGSTITPWTILARHLRNSKEIGWVSGGAMLVRRKAFWSVGGFDQSFFLYWEDVDFCRRLKEAGWQVVLSPQSKVFHVKGASLTDPVQKTRIYDQSADNYFRKHYPKVIWYGYTITRRLYRLFSPRVY